jgi:uncharacterized protein YacL
VDDDPWLGSQDVESVSSRLTRERGTSLLTTDSSLERVAEAFDVRAPSIGALADALRAPIRAGHRITIRLIRAGRDTGQAVGSLDGTMVIVEGAATASDGPKRLV